MPIYEYRCEACGAKFELLRRLSDSDDELTCQECGSEKVTRQFSAFAASSGSGGGGFSSTSGGGCNAPSGFT